MNELREAVERLLITNAEIEQAEEIIKKMKRSRAELEAKIVEQKEALGLGKSVDLEGLAVVKFTDKLTTKMVDRDAFGKWIEDNDLTELGTWSVHHSRINSLTKERVAKGEGVPAGIEIGNFTKVSLKGNENG